MGDLESPHIPSAAVLESLGVPAAVVSRDGVIIMINSAWRDGRRLMPVPSDAVDVGQNLFTACELAGQAGLQRAGAVHAGFVAVGDGNIEEYVDDLLWDTHGRPRVIAVSIRPLGNSEHLIITLRDVTDSRNRQIRLEHQATHDQLTDLANRGLFMELFGQAVTVSQRHDYRVAVLFCDLDDFKAANEIIGHQLGDELLRAAGSRIKSCVRPSDVVARFGGDEFLIMLPDVDEDSTVEHIARRLIAEVGRPFRLHGHRIEVGLSVGIAFADADDDPEDIVHRANQAMFVAKQAGKGRYSIAGISSSTSIGFHSQLDLTQLSEEHMLTYFQPIVDNSDGAIVGAEALLRWAHPQYGVLTASEFLSLAVNNGVMATLAEQALVCAAETWVDMCDRIPGQPPVLFVNLSIDQLRNRASVDRLRHLLFATGLPPQNVVVEVAEGALSSRFRELVEVLNRLRNVGIRVALDDFGSAYSSLGRLRQVPAEVLKLDRSMVRGIENDLRARSIVSAMATLAHDLGMDCIAEGCENAREAEVLAQLGIRYVQGYYYCYPVAADDFVEMLQGQAMLMA